MNRLTEAAILPTGHRRPSAALAHGRRAALFPQVLGFVQAYVGDRVHLHGLDPREIGLQVHAEQVVSRLFGWEKASATNCADDRRLCPDERPTQLRLQT